MNFLIIFGFFIRLRTVLYKKTKKLQLKMIKIRKYLEVLPLGRGEALK